MTILYYVVSMFVFWGLQSFYMWQGNGMDVGEAIITFLFGVVPFVNSIACIVMVVVIIQQFDQKTNFLSIPLFKGKENK